jgi:L-rhamnose isomerase/sugar isomerase
VEEMIQTAITAQELYVKATLVDHAELAKFQASADLVDAEECLKDAFSTDVRPAIVDWRKSKGLPANPIKEFRASGYIARIEKERGEKNAAAVSSYA